MSRAEMFVWIRTELAFALNSFACINSMMQPAAVGTLAFAKLMFANLENLLLA